MSKFTVTISWEGHKLEVQGSDSKCLPATHESPAEGGLEEITGVYLLDDKGKRIELPESIQAHLDWMGMNNTFDDKVNEALEEARTSDPEDHE